MDNQNNTFKSEAEIMETIAAVTPAESSADDAPLIQPVKPEPIAPPVPEKKEVNVVAIVLGVIAGIFAIVAIVFLVKYFTEKPKCEVEAVVQEPSEVIDNELAQNLIRPYTKSLGFLYNLLDVEFNDSVKILLSFDNLRASDSDGDCFVSDGCREDYGFINSIYQGLFGDESSLAKENYYFPSEEHSIYTFTYNAANDNFYLMIGGTGGTGAAMFTIVRDAFYDGNNIVVNVYHDNKLSPCGVNENDGYCIDSGYGSVTVDSIEEYNMRDLIEKFGDKIPVYKMIFTKNAGHYVLSDIQKPDAE